MMGQRGGSQERLFYSFNLDDHVPTNHLLRSIDRVFDLGDLREHLAPYYSNTGRPSIDPELMVRMLIVGYCFGIRSERRLCEEIHLNLAYRWFCRLGLEDPIPDHSTFSKNRHGRFRDSEALRHVFETVLRRCMTEGLVRGEGFAIDASVIKADANRSRAVPGTQTIDWSKGDGPSRAVREYLAVLDEANQINGDGSNEAEVASPPTSISLTDPAARWTAAPGGPAFFAYSTNYLIDLHAGIILDVEATPANRAEEVESTKTMIDRVEQRFALKPRRLAGDTAYGTARMLAWMVGEKEIAPHVPIWDKTRRNDGTFERDDFQWDEHHNEYRCPAGHAMRSDWRAYAIPRTHITKAETVIYRSSQHNCNSCSMKEQCCPNMPFRKIARSVHENARDVARKLSATPEFKQSRRERKKVEMLFAHLKRILKLDRLRLRGLSGAQDEFLLAATAQNLRRMAKRLAPLGEEMIAAAV
ncbi:IS1182 family transposase [Burkholderia sp. MSMB1835]|uniref:IS1182 family transposase n=1 Tax=Burkholderia sp. MSMB1835 TaxID=1637876 RepID=UPI0007571E0C|nr:IS1182 family transposase [Burkholderia sp. MSMB1835]KVL32074.1 transposase [Burkholderia sp. MSMB1835]